MSDPKTNPPRNSTKANVVMYSKDPCPYCVRAKRLLTEKGIEFEEIDLTNDLDRLNSIKEQTGWRTVPIILINEKLIGGYTDLKSLDDSGQLDSLIKNGN